MANNGPEGAIGVTMVDTLPEGTTFETATPDQGSCSHLSGTLTCAIGAIANGESVSVEIEVAMPSSTGMITNTALVSSTSNDPDPADNEAEESTTVVVPEADLSITKDDQVETAIPGQGVTYMIVVGNAGPNDAQGATVSDSFPAELTSVSWTCVGAGGATCTASGTDTLNDTVDLPLNATATYTVTATVDAGASGDTLENTAAVTPPAGVTDNNAGNNTATDTDTLAHAPSITGLDADPEETDATLMATVSPNAASTLAWFEWGLTVAFGETTTPPSDVGSTGQTDLDIDISGLAEDTVYYYQCVAENAVDTTSSWTSVFKTGTEGSAYNGHFPVAIGGGQEYLTLQEACDAALDNDIILLWEGVYTGDLDVLLGDSTHAILIQGGWNGDFSERAGDCSTIQGMITISLGEVTLDGICIQ